MAAPLRIDGGMGEGGGQILRSALALSAITQKPVELTRIRAGRNKPGLRPQHLAAVRGLAQVCGAEVSGAEAGSQQLSFRPGPLRSGDYVFDVGTAGSVTLLLQALVYPLALAGARSTLVLKGGTHAPHSPPFHYLSLVWRPLVERMGFKVELSMPAAGFVPEGGGEVRAVVHPAQVLVPLDLPHRGTLAQVEVLSCVAGLPFGVAERQNARALKRLREAGLYAEAETLPLPSHASRGSMVLVWGDFEHARAAASALGEKGKPAEKVADEAVEGFNAFMESRGALDPQAGDQALLPAALVAAGTTGPGGLAEVPPPASRYTVSRVTRHLLTHAEVVQKFLEVRVRVSGAEGEEGEVRVEPV